MVLQSKSKAEQRSLYKQIILIAEYIILISYVLKIKMLHLDDEVTFCIK